MTTLRIILGDQCSEAIAALDGLDPARDVVLMAEVRAECTYVRHHKQKIVLVLSAMRHLARRLEARGIRVAYTRLDDPANTHSLAGEVARIAAQVKPARIVCTHPGEWRVLQDMRDWQSRTGIPVEIREDTRFLCTLDRFKAWAGVKKQLRMEFFYREMRRVTGLLMEGAEPAGGQWNFDHDNRERLPADITPPHPAAPAPLPARCADAGGDGAGGARIP
jgi:deoxyribodipyrimidine photolyase-related protein